MDAAQTADDFDIFPDVAGASDGSADRYPASIAQALRARLGKRNWPVAYIGLVTAILPTTYLVLTINMLFVLPLLVGLTFMIIGSMRTRFGMSRYAELVALVVCTAASFGPIAARAVF